MNNPKVLLRGLKIGLYVLSKSFNAIFKIRVALNCAVIDKRTTLSSITSICVFVLNTSSELPNTFD